MVLMKGQYLGDLRSLVRHQPSGEAVQTDAPVDNEGRGDSFSPTDLLAAATVTCMMTTMGITARDHGWNLEGTRFSVEKEMARSGIRRVGGLLIRFSLPPGLSPEAKSLLEGAARGCPVESSLAEGLSLEVVFDRA